MKGALILFYALALIGTGFMGLFLWAFAAGAPFDAPLVKGLLTYILALQFLALTKGK